MSPARLSLCTWTKAAIDAECAVNYRRYERELIEHYTRYFAARPDLRCRKQPYSATSIETALPPGWGSLKRLISTDLFHRHARSGRSSQILALTVIGAAAQVDPTLKTLWRTLRIPVAGEHTHAEFERALTPSDLGEYPRVSTLDCVLATSTTMAIIEGKFSERGLGGCSCTRDGDGDPNEGFDCAARVNQRDRYWRTAFQEFGLPPYRVKHSACAVSLAYQAIRNVAAARVLSKGRRTVFVLLFDESNPYFSGCGTWPGWPAIIRHSLRSDSDLIFRAVSWQHVVGTIDIPQDVRAWLSTKHRLPVVSSI